MSNILEPYWVLIFSLRMADTTQKGDIRHVCHIFMFGVHRSGPNFTNELLENDYFMVIFL